MKFLLYDINPGEQFFKQFAGFMYFIQLAQRKNYTLVLPPFRIRKPNFGLSILILFQQKKITSNTLLGKIFMI